MNLPRRGAEAPGAGAAEWRLSASPSAGVAAIRAGMAGYPRSKSTMLRSSMRVMIAVDARRPEPQRELVAVAAIIVAALLALGGTINVALQAGSGRSAPAAPRSAPATPAHGS